MTHLSWSLKLLHMFSIEKIEAHKDLRPTVANAKIASSDFVPKEMILGDTRWKCPWKTVWTECYAVLLRSAPPFQDWIPHSFHSFFPLLECWWLKAMSRYSWRTVFCQREHLTHADPLPEVSLHPVTDSCSSPKAETPSLNFKSEGPAIMCRIGPHPIRELKS